MLSDMHTALNVAIALAVQLGVLGNLIKYFD